jgi:hypothetical protein
MPDDAPAAQGERKRYYIRRLPLVRHVRWFFWNFMLNLHVERMRRIGLGICANPSDIEALDQIWEGAL